MSDIEFQRGGLSEPLPNNQQDIDCDMEDHPGVTHLDDVSELLLNTQQVIDIVSDMEVQREGLSEPLPIIDCDMEDHIGVTHLDDVSEALPNTQQ